MRAVSLELLGLSTTTDFLSWVFEGSGLWWAAHLLTILTRTNPSPGQGLRHALNSFRLAYLTTTHTSHIAFRGPCLSVNLLLSLRTSQRRSLGSPLVRTGALVGMSNNIHQSTPKRFYLTVKGRNRQPVTFQPDRGIESRSICLSRFSSLAQPEFSLIFFLVVLTFVSSLPLFGAEMSIITDHFLPFSRAIPYSLQFSVNKGVIGRAIHVFGGARQRRTCHIHKGNGSASNGVVCHEVTFRFSSPCNLSSGKIIFIICPQDLENVCRCVRSHDLRDSFLSHIWILGSYSLCYPLFHFPATFRCNHREIYT